MNKQEIKIYHGNSRVGHLYFYETEDNIHVSDLEIEEKERMKGYGKILIRVMLGIATALKKPIYLYSYRSSVDFYEKFGFYQQRLFKDGEYDGKTVIFSDLEKGYLFETQVSDCDLIWFPPNINNAIIPVSFI